MIAALAAHYRNSPPPATFRLIVNPIVIWIWLGGIVVLAGALTSLWPAPATRSRRAVSLARARLGRELSRA